MKDGKLYGAVINGIRTDLLTHTNDLDAHIKSFGEVLRTGTELHTPGYLTATGGVIVADTLYAMPLWIPRAMTLDRLAIDVTTLAAGGARLGIYNDGTNLYPGTLVVDGGVVAVTGTGVKTVTIAESLTKGLYWVVVVSDVTPTLGMLTPYAGLVLGIDATDFSKTYRGWTVSHTYGALPDPFTSGGALNSSSIARPAIAIRLSSLD